tara:strand:+ start:30 stop:1046 length:1017 start_codon:yes stop_codon:yes gene_type:complete
MNILLIGYCHLADGFLYASNALKKFGYEIYFFPYLIYKMDNNNNLFSDFKKLLIDKNIDICLWWNNSIPYAEILEMINLNKNNIFFNWDPFLYDYSKYNSNFWKNLIDNKKQVYKLMNNIFTCFEKEITYFNDYSIHYNPPGFDEYISTYSYDKEYVCDISFILTNLYNNSEQFPPDATNLNRFDIVNEIYKNRDKINFHIYGPENLKELYNDCYKGFIKYDDCYKVFSNSKINLSIHPIVNELNSTSSEYEYFSERLPQILGCKGLLMTNSNLNSILKKNEDYIYIDNNTNYIDIINNIIKNNDKFNKIRENGYNKAYLNYRWYNWASKINQVLKNQ